MKPYSFILTLLFLAFILRFVIFYANFKNPRVSMQQDFYIPYAAKLKDGMLKQSTRENLRLFPGYPLLINVLDPIIKNKIITGVAISMASAILAIYLFFLITKNKLLTALFAFFPPVWIAQGAKVATEVVCLSLMLLSIFLLLRKKYLISGLLVGFATDIRLIGVCLFIVLLLVLFESRKFKQAALLSLGFLISFSLLFVFNFFVFGASDLFIQFEVYPSFAKATVGFVQIFLDIARTIDWKQYRILVSGLSYLFINLIALALFIKNRKKHKKLSFFRISLYWFVFSLLFVFIYSPTPLLEEFARFTVPFTPALIYGLSLINERSKV